MVRAAPAPKVPTVKQGTHLTLRSHLNWDRKRVSQSSKEGGAHQPGGYRDASWRRGPMKTGIGDSNM